MRSTLGFLAAAGLALAAAPVAADPGAGVGQDAYVGLNWDQAPHTGAVVAAPALAATQDAYVGPNWDRPPGMGAPSTAAARAAAKPGPRSSNCACTCLARAR